ncbi:hypothetical protein DLB95_21715 [Salmonella enterica subsp. diarizonae]|uniref:Uncharacterized protein n=1 Tax=Salmonella diarizonae TaxID=59204 RepID=A0A5Y3W7N6_SALDZ|nr:hypothetical protein [Salmonella enterica subsp. diarizonae]ECJ4379771.1 hypothetical protein [Salmonella enterica subsp. diarizonae]
MVQRDNTDGYYLNIGKNNGQIREINQPASGSPENLIRYPGYLFCQFRLTGILVEGRYGFIFYLKLAASAIPSGVDLANQRCDRSARRFFYRRHRCSARVLRHPTWLTANKPKP